MTEKQQKRRDYYLAHKEQYRINGKKYYEKNKEKIIKERKESRRERSPIKKEKESLRSKEYAITHKEEIKKQRAKYRELNKEIIKERAKKYRLSHKEIIKERNRIYYKTYKPKSTGSSMASKYDKEKKRQYYLSHKEQINKRMRERLKTDAIFSLRQHIRCRVSQAFSRIKLGKPSKTVLLLGSDYLVVKTHIEKQFKQGMCWDNYGFKTWHIDHIVPLSTAKTEQELIKLCHYTNLQPLWAIDNFKKSNK